MKVTIPRFLVVFALALSGVLPSGRHAAADMLPQAAHASSPAPSPAQARVGAAAHLQPLRPGYQFPYGQTLHYEGEWRFWTAGVATMRIERSGSQEHVQATADSNGVVALLYRVQDRFNSYFDSKSLCSSQLTKHAEEGSHRRDTVITYDYSRGKAILEEHNISANTQKRTENDIPGCVTDVVSGLFYVSSLPLQIGATYIFPLNDGGQTTTVQARVEGREQVKTPAGTFQTLRVGPQGDSGILKNKGRIWIWYTDDQRHIPVQMRAKLFWGTLTVYLTSMGK